MTTVMTNKHICFYITGHGYGHFTRSAKIIKDLINKFDYQVTIVSVINFEFVKQNLEPYLTEGKLNYIKRKLDTGAVQTGPLDLDLKQTLESYYSEIHLNHERLVTQEAEFLRLNQINLVLTDVTPLVCAAADTANIKSVILSNLTWNYIYDDMLKSISSTLSDIEMNKYSEMIRQCDKDYASCTFHYRLPGPTPMIPNISLSKIIPCPLISRPSISTKIDVLNRLNLQDSHAHILILSFGGHDFSSFQIKEEYLPQGWVCLLLGFREEEYRPLNQPSKLSSRFIFCPNDSYVPDLVQVADALLGKIGYGTVSECLSSTPVTPLIYIPRDGWPEEPYLINILNDNNCGVSMPRNQFYGGEWSSYLEESIRRKDSLGVYTTSVDSSAADTHLRFVGVEAGQWIAQKLSEI